jgi:hypothetical protein
LIPSRIQRSRRLLSLLQDIRQPSGEPVERRRFKFALALWFTKMRGEHAPEMAISANQWRGLRCGYPASPKYVELWCADKEIARGNILHEDAHALRQRGRTGGIATAHGAKKLKHFVRKSTASNDFQTVVLLVEALHCSQVGVHHGDGNIQRFPQVSRVTLGVHQTLQDRLICRSFGAAPDKVGHVIVDLRRPRRNSLHTCSSKWRILGRSAGQGDYAKLRNASVSISAAVPRGFVRKQFGLIDGRQ